MIIECNVWCNGRTDSEIQMGLEPGDSWMPFAIDFREIETIKLCGENDFLGDDKASVNKKSGSTYTLDITFVNAVKIWKEL